MSSFLRRHSLLLILALLSAVSLAGALALQERSFPVASVQFHLLREDAEREARSYLADLGYPVEGYRSVVAFEVDEAAKNYCKAQGIRTLFYTEPWGRRQSFPQAKSKAEMPPYEERLAQVKQWAAEPDETARWGSAPRALTAKAVLNSLLMGPDGIGLHLVDLYSTWAQWWQLNTTPDITEPNIASLCWEYEVAPALEWADGIYLDSVSMALGAFEDYAPAHLAAAGVPLSFSLTTVSPRWARFTNSASSFSASPRRVPACTHRRRYSPVAGFTPSYTTAYHFLPFFWMVPRISVPFGSNRMGTSSSERGRRSRDVRRGSGAAPSTIRLENPKIDPYGCRGLDRVATLGSSGPPSRGAEMPSRGAAYRCHVVDPRPHSRKNSRNLAAWAWERPSSISRKGPLTRYFSWWRGADLNRRPSGYEPDELPDCSTPQERG